MFLIAEEENVPRIGLMIPGKDRSNHFRVIKLNFHRNLIKRR